MAASVDAPGNVFVDDLTADDRLEWNVVRDPPAFASIVESDVPITLVPPDATDDVPTTDDLKSRLAGSAAGRREPRLRALGARAGPHVVRGSSCGTVAALTLVEPDLATVQEIKLAVAPSGRLDRSDAGREMRVAMSADNGAVDDAFMQALERGGPRATPFEAGGPAEADPPVSAGSGSA